MRRKGKRSKLKRKCDGQEKETKQAQQAAESKPSLASSLSGLMASSTWRERERNKERERERGRERERAKLKCLF